MLITLLRAQKVFEFLSSYIVFLFLELLEKKRKDVKKLQGKGILSKTLKIFIYRYSYTSTLHALRICPLESKYLHLRTAGERRTKLIRLVGITVFYYKLTTG